MKQYTIRTMYFPAVVMALFGIGFIVLRINFPIGPIEFTSESVMDEMVILVLPTSISFLTSIYLIKYFYIMISQDGVFVRVGKRRDDMKWDDMKSVGYFLIRGQPIMFFSTIPGIWKIHGMFGNDLPLSVLIKVFPNKKIEALVKEYYKGEIVYLE